MGADGRGNPAAGGSGTTFPTLRKAAETQLCCVEQDRDGLTADVTMSGARADYQHNFPDVVLGDERRLRLCDLLKRVGLGH